MSSIFSALHHHCNQYLLFYWTSSHCLPFVKFLPCWLIPVSRLQFQIINTGLKGLLLNPAICTFAELLFLRESPLFSYLCANRDFTCFVSAIPKEGTIYLVSHSQDVLHLPLYLLIPKEHTSWSQHKRQMRGQITN